MSAKLSRVVLVVVAMLGLNLTSASSQTIGPERGKFADPTFAAFTGDFSYGRHDELNIIYLPSPQDEKFDFSRNGPVVIQRRETKRAFFVGPYSQPYCDLALTTAKSSLNQTLVESVSADHGEMNARRDLYAARFASSGAGDVEGVLVDRGAAGICIFFYYPRTGANVLAQVEFFARYIGPIFTPSGNIYRDGDNRNNLLNDVWHPKPAVVPMVAASPAKPEPDVCGGKLAGTWRRSDGAAVSIAGDSGRVTTGLGTLTAGFTKFETIGAVQGGPETCTAQAQCNYVRSAGGQVLGSAGETCTLTYSRASHSLTASNGHGTWALVEAAAPPPAPAPVQVAAASPPAPTPGRTLTSAPATSKEALLRAGPAAREANPKAPEPARPTPRPTGSSTTSISDGSFVSNTEAEARADVERKLAGKCSPSMILLRPEERGASVSAVITEKTLVCHASQGKWGCDATAKCTLTGPGQGGSSRPAGAASF